MAARALPDGLIRDVLDKDIHAIRFEQFCCDLLSEAEQRHYVVTSRSYDLSRDARTISGELAVVCCGTSGDFDDKAESDLRSLLQSATPVRVYFCSNRAKSEAYLQRVKENLRSIAPQVNEVDAIGSYQLATLVQRCPEPFIRRYTSELLDYRETLLEGNLQTVQMEVAGFQVALATQFQDDARALRDDLIYTLILSVLAEKGPQSPSLLAKGVSDTLRLPRIIKRETLAEHLRFLETQSFLAFDGRVYQITEPGLERHRSLRAAGATQLRKGRDLIHNALEILLGGELAPPSFDALWSRLQDEFANLFFSHGMRLVQLIGSLVSSDCAVGASRTFSELLAGLRKMIAKSGIGGGRSEDVAQAVVDLFDDRSSNVFQWLTEMAVKYVSLCALGLEPNAQQVLALQLGRIDLLLDTDVVLSYLSEGERPHEAVEGLLRRWRELGGAMRIAPPVIEEAAYHAWISEWECREIGPLFASLAPEEVHRFAKNAFVRSFYRASKGRYNPVAWARFISEYRGQHASDSSRIAAVLKEEHFELMSDAEFFYDHGFARNVANKIYDLRKIGPEDYVPKAVGDKVARDGQLLAYLRLARHSSSTQERILVMVSSSPILLETANVFAAELGDPPPVWPIGAIGYMLSMLPGVQLTLTSLRTCLFAEGDEGLDQITQLALRVIKQSTQFELGYSRRATLKRALHSQIAKVARERGQRPRELLADLTEQPTQTREILTEVVANAVDEIVASRSEKEIAELRAQLKKYESRA